MTVNQLGIFLLCSICSSCLVRPDNTNSLDACGKQWNINANKTYQLGNARLEFPDNWKVRPAEKYMGLEAADTSEFTNSLRILTFSIHEFQADGSKLADYFRSEVELMKQDTMKLGILEQGTREIDHNPSYYVITSDTIEGNVFHQLFFYAETRGKSYTIQIGSSDMKNPLSEFCEHLWLIDSIVFI